MKNPRRDIRKAGCKIAADGNGKKKKKIKREERLEKKKKNITASYEQSPQASMVLPRI